MFIYYCKITVTFNNNSALSNFSMKRSNIDNYRSSSLYILLLDGRLVLADILYCVLEITSKKFFDSMPLQLLRLSAVLGGCCCEDEDGSLLCSGFDDAVVGSTACSGTVLPEVMCMPAARRGALHVPLLTHGACRRAQTGGADEFGVRLTVMCHEIIILRHCFLSSPSDISFLNRKL